MTAVIAIPPTAPASTSAQVAPVRMAEASVAEELVSSLVPVSVKLCPLVIVGASLTLVTVIWAEALFVEKAVVPPRWRLSHNSVWRLVDAVPLVWSQAL